MTARTTRDSVWIAAGHSLLLVAAGPLVFVVALNKAKARPDQHKARPDFAYSPRIRYTPAVARPAFSCLPAPGCLQLPASAACASAIANKELVLTAVARVLPTHLIAPPQRRASAASPRHTAAAPMPRYHRRAVVQPRAEEPKQGADVTFSLSIHKLSRILLLVCSTIFYARSSPTNHER